MTPHRCTGDVDTCQVCGRGRDAIEARRTEDASERHVRRVEDRFERWACGERRGL